MSEFANGNHPNYNEQNISNSEQESSQNSQVPKSTRFISDEQGNVTEIKEVTLFDSLNACVTKLFDILFNKNNNQQENDELPLPKESPPKVNKPLKSPTLKEEINHPQSKLSTKTVQQDNFFQKIYERYIRIRGSFSSIKKLTLLFFLVIIILGCLDFLLGDPNPTEPEVPPAVSL